MTRICNSHRHAIICAVLAALLSACGASGPGDNYRDNRGNSGHFADLRGKWLVVNYWAVWCKPCIKEIPELNQFSSDNRDRVTLFGVDFDQSQGPDLQQSIDKLGIEFPVLTTDPAGPLGFERPNVLPTTLVFDPQGKLYKSLRGPQTTESLQNAISP